jgi:hypothetical protein
VRASFLDYLPIISALIFSGLLAVSILQFSAVRKNMRMSEQHIYARIMDARIRLENSEAFTKIARESPLSSERFGLVDKPEEYYSIVAFLDLFEFIFRLNKTRMIDAQLWVRWKELVKMIMTIPKFRKVRGKTKQIHTPEFVAFVDSL